MSPIQMIETVLEHDPDREVLAKLHPKETYAAAEMRALERLAEHPRLRIVEGDLEPYLAGGDYVVAMNSSVVLKGLFFEKPAILFADCEFHHICQSVPRDGDVAGAFRQVMAARPAFEKYLFWYLQRNCINVNWQSAGARVVEHCRELGWDI